MIIQLMNLPAVCCLQLLWQHGLYIGFWFIRKREDKIGQHLLSYFHKKQIYFKKLLIFRIESCMIRTRTPKGVK